MKKITNDTGKEVTLEHLVGRSPAFPPIQLRNKATDEVLVLSEVSLIVWDENRTKIVDATVANTKFVLSNGNKVATLQMSQSDWDALPKGNNFKFELKAISNEKTFSVINGPCIIKKQPD